ncbi:MAG: TraR/DksA family transcriptional regulator [Chlamydiota bacterium]|nr:TraR/DksA family transcriptional regulator [Chlamydiota bacterium]
MSLSEEEIAVFRQQLEEMKDNIMKKLQMAADDVKKVAEQGKGDSQHQLDDGSDNFNQQVAFQISEGEQEILDKVEHALERINKGTYGLCEVTGRPIPKARLQAIPYATMTVEAQQAAERDKG